MKWLKKYSIFLEQDETSDDINSTEETSLIDDNDKTNQESLDLIQKDLSEFGSKKGVVEDILSDMEKNDSQIDSELQQKVFNNQREDSKRNKYLRMLVSLHKLKRRTDKLALAIETDVEKKSEVQKQISDLIERFNQLENPSQKVKVDSQRKKSEEYLKELNLKINDNKKELALSEKNYDKKKEDFEKQMKIEEEKIKSLQK
jgi:hypothetical protein